MLARATLNGLAGRVVALGPPVAHPCSTIIVDSDLYAFAMKVSNTYAMYYNA